MTATESGRNGGPEVDDPLPAGLVTNALAQFGLHGQASATFLRHGENTTYSVIADDGRRFALRINRPGYQTDAAIRSELAWMESLRAGGIRTPVPAAGVDGDPLQRATAPAGWSRTVVMFKWVDGVPLSAVGKVEPWERLGALTAQLHAHARAWDHPGWFTRPAWDAEALVGDDPRWGPPDPDGLFAGEDRLALEACRAEVQARLAAIGTGPDRFGLIHGDMGFENVLVTGDGTVVIIDFDDSGYSWHLHDFAATLYPHEGDAGLDQRRDALVAGYRRERDIPEDLLAELPTFMMARRIQTLGWVFSHAETAHAQRQRGRRLASTPRAAREFLAWAGDHSV